MNKAVLVVTSHMTSAFLKDFKNSVRRYNNKYPIIYLENTPENNQYEMLAINKGIEWELDEFVVLHDTCIIKDYKLFDMFFYNSGRSVSISPNFLSYLGKFRLETLLNIAIPKVSTKAEAVSAEDKFLKEYISKEPKHLVLFPDFDDNFKWMTKHGRMNMVLENKYLIKYKGCWHPSMITN